MGETFDFGGWATKYNVVCSDGRIIRRDAFKHHDGQTVPLVWNHDHKDPLRILGHAKLEDREEGMYVYGSLNDGELAKTARIYLEHGDITQLSIWANELVQQGPNVMHGTLREVSLVLAGANPEAYIETVLRHGVEIEDEAYISFAGEIVLSHSADDTNDDKKEEKDMGGDSKETPKNEKTIKEVIDSMTEEQQEAMHAMVGLALEASKGNDNDDDSEEGGEKSMKHNLFEKEEQKTGGVLSHSDQQSIIKMAKSSSVGSLREAINIYAENNDSLSHGIEDIEQLFPDYQDVRPGAPEFIERDQGWVGVVMQKTRKSPISRIRTRQMDITGADLRGKGYKKGDQKTVSGNMKLLKRTTDPQTVYVKDSLHRDDIIDITDFNVVEYQYGVMKQNLNEEVAIAIMIGDGRDEGDDNKIAQEHIRSIFLDDDLYAIHADVDIAAAKAELQGSDTGANFGENYIYAEAIISAALYAREGYKGSGTPDFYCTPHLLNVMLLARDLNGRRIYDSKADLAAALNVGAIHTAEQFEGKTRTTDDAKTKKLLGIFVNLDDYQLGSTKGGEITKFNQFDINFNTEQYLIETRLSGALTRVKSAIVLEEDITGAAG